MRAEDCISISELKKSPSQVIKSLERDKKKYIFVNNKPVAMVVDFLEAEKLGYTDDSVFFDTMPKVNISSEWLKQLAESQKIERNRYVNF